MVETRFPGGRRMTPQSAIIIICTIRQRRKTSLSGPLGRSQCRKQVPWPTRRLTAAGLSGTQTVRRSRTLLTQNCGILTARKSTWCASCAQACSNNHVPFAGAVRSREHAMMMTVCPVCRRRTATSIRWASSYGTFRTAPRMRSR
eukprot:7391464-Prymnesium_polylepis.1